MKIRCFCITCTQELAAGSPDGEMLDPPIPVRTYLVQVKDAPFYELTCSLGHKTAFAVQSMRHETLAEIGLSAIRDGYYRDAVGSFAAAVERFHEAFIRAAWTSKEISPPNRDEAWKMVNSQSERQYGMFVSEHLSAVGKAPPPFPKKQVEFRNSVIHKGHIPDMDSAIVYAQAAIDYMRPLIVEAKKLPHDAWIHLMMDAHREAWEEAARFGTPTTIAIPSILTNPRELTVVEALAESR